MGVCNPRHNPEQELEVVQPPPVFSFKTHRIVEETRYLPPISNKITKRLEEVQPFFKIKKPKSEKVYKVRGGGYYEGDLKLINSHRTFHGPGRFLMSEGILIESEFCEGYPKLITRVYKPNGDYFQGILNDEQQASEGTLQENGIKYKGSLFKYRPHGTGVENSENFSFEGEYENGKKVSGKLKWNFNNPKNIYTYEGSFLNNEFSGHGTLKNREGLYIGQFLHGKKHGKGKLVNNSGKVYEGNFLNDFFASESKIKGPEVDNVKQESNEVKVDNSEQESQQAIEPVNMLNKSTING